MEPYPEEHRFLESQADVAFGLIEAYECTGHTPYLAAARQIVDFASNNLAVPGQTALIDHLEGPAEIGLLANRRWPIRANARIARAMLRLAFHGQGEPYRDQATSIMSAF